MIYSWERFWIKKGGSYHPDHFGFLHDPEEQYSPNYECKSFDDLQEKSLLFLLGEPGIGKSKTIEQIHSVLKSNQQNTHLINLRLVNDATTLQNKVFQDPIIQAWQNSDATLELFLDSYDEGLLGFENITAHIIDSFQKIPQEKLKTLKLRIVCRTAELPQMLEKELKALFTCPEDEVVNYELLILRYKDIENALRIEHIDCNNFMQHIEQNDLSIFVALPVTFSMLLNLYKETESLPHGKWEIYTNGLLHLAKESSEQRNTLGKIGVLTPNERLALASKTAFYFLFANKHTFLFDNDLSVLESYDDLKSHVISSKESIQELINTSLFAARENGRFGFVHRTFIDFLAAKYIVENHISIDLIMPMLIDMKKPYKRVVPQLMETTSWLATQKSEYFEILKNYNPDVIVQGDLSKLSDRQKDNLVQQCLKAIEYEYINELHNDTLKYFPKLLTKNTLNLLKPYFFSSSRNIFSRRVAIEIATICEIKEVEKYIFQILHNSIEYLPLRISAIRYIVKLNSGTYTEELKYYAAGIEEDKEDELKAYALKALFPKYISINDFLTFLQERKEKNIFGKYQRFLQHEFYASLTDIQTIAVIRWLMQNHDTSLYRKLIHPIIVKAWEYIDQSSALFHIFVDLIILLISSCALATTSSIFAGWILPSRIKFSRASLATCRRTGSKDEMTIAPGVSSMINSTPDSFSNARMFLPSLPIILPLISSFGIFTEVVSISLAVDDAKRLMLEAMISFARRSNFSAFNVSIFCIRTIKSSSYLFSTSSNKTSRASSLERRAIFSSSLSFSSSIPSTLSFIFLTSSTLVLIFSTSLSISV